VSIDLKEFSSVTKVEKDLAGLKTPIKGRPNIDHLIKRILVERRKKIKKDLLTFVFIILLVIGAMMLSFNN
jgi:hypothetical protein|tara:strand:- start:340 stop:552 length:213 start_codon:yes stop_codon:yes gene_type:complete